jgi:hypothetical protein
LRPGAVRLRCRRPTMFDALMLAIGCGFFAVAVLYGLACERM